MSKVVTFALAICGATAAWVVCLFSWLSIGGRASYDIAHWLTILFFTAITPGLTLFRKPGRWGRVATFTAIAMFMAVFLGASIEMRPSDRVELLLTDPFVIFPPSRYAAAAILGAAIGLWLDEIRAFIDYASRLATRKDRDEDHAQEWYNRKSALMAKILGQENDWVMHAIIPYAIGGGLDLYYYPHGIPGTAIATKELSETPGEGPSNDVFDAYELVMFTRHPLSHGDLQDDSTPLGQAHRSINGILNCVARYSTQAKLNPNETCEFPEEMEVVGGKCLIFDAYAAKGERAEFGLLLIIAIHRSEMEFAMAHGGGMLIAKLKDAGHYPYSDLDRPAVA